MYFVDEGFECPEPTSLGVSIAAVNSLRYDELKVRGRHLLCLRFGYARLQRQQMLVATCTEAAVSDPCR